MKTKEEIIKRIEESKVITTVNINIRQKLLLDKYPEFKLSEWLRDNLTEEVIKNCIKNEKYVWQNKITKEKMKEEMEK